jgi:CheY-like chemotaxis protein
MPRSFVPPLRVLLADDEEVYLRATAEMLREEGFLVDTAPDAGEATRLLEAGGYDALVSDIRMPGNLRFEFIKRIGELAPDLPVIIVTAHPTVETATDSINLSVVAYLTKPLPVEVLIEHLLRCGSVARTRRAVGQYEERLRSWSADLQRLQRARMAPQGQPSKDLAREVLGLSLGHLADLFSDMSSLFTVALGEEPGSLPCVNGHCPRLDSYQQAIGDGIRVLEETRTSFKSKELGALRQRLEQQLAR